MGFREQVERDRHAVFANLDEFGEIHRIDRVKVRAVIDGRERTGRDLDMGLSGDGLRIFARTEDMPPRRAPGMPISVDGIAYMVDSWAEEMGVAEVSVIRAQ